MEESGRVDDEGRPILERVDLMEAFFTVRSEKKNKKKKMYLKRLGFRRFVSRRWRGWRMHLSLGISCMRVLINPLLMLCL